MSFILMTKKMSNARVLNIFSAIKRFNYTNSLGVFFIICGVFFNEWFIDKLLLVIHEKPLDSIRLPVLYFLQISSICIGCVFVFCYNSSKKFICSLLPDVSIKGLLLIISLVLPMSIFWVVGCNIFGIEIHSGYGLFCLEYKLIANFSVIYALLIIASSLGFFVYALLGMSYICFTIMELVLLRYAHERLCYKFFGMVFGSDCSGYLTIVSVISLILLISIYLFVLRVSFEQLEKEPSVKAIKLLSVYFVLSVCPIILTGNVLYAASFESAERYAYLGQVSKFNYLHDGPIVRLIKVIALSQKENSFHRITHDDFKSNSLAKKLHLTDTEAAVYQTPFKRIVLVTSESMSEAYSQLGQVLNKDDLTPHYNLLKRDYVFSQNYWTASSTTINGLSVSWCGHPNPVLLQTNEFPNSFVWKLKEDGFLTAFFRSAPEYFQNGSVFMPQAGFSILRGRNYYSKVKEYIKYISNWGLPDRFLYEDAVNFLKENKDKKVFLQLLGCDTHLPKGRTTYFDMDYPVAPDWVYETPFPELLESVYYHDYDIYRFIEKLKTENLLDEDTLVILTADHSMPIGMLSSKLEGFHTDLDPIPLIFISKKPIQLAGHERSSQLDLAPTILDLQNIGIPSGYWGKSLLSHVTKKGRFGFYGHEFHVDTSGISTVIDTKNPYGDTEEQLIELFNSFVE